MFRIMKQTRLKTVWFFGISIALLSAYSIYKEMPQIAVIGVAALGGIVSHYMHSETKRPSKNVDLLNSENN